MLVTHSVTLTSSLCISGSLSVIKKTRHQKTCLRCIKEAGRGLALRGVTEGPEYQ